MKYCEKCLMPDTRPGIIFDTDGVCIPCKNYEKMSLTDWGSRKIELENICNKYRGKYGNGYDCAISVSGGKDSHFQVWYVKEIMGMNPVLLSVGNTDWTETGRKNIANLSDTFNCDIISITPNHNITRLLAKKTFIEIGVPTWYVDALIYAYPYRMTMKLGLNLLIYGENTEYTYGGKYNFETSSAKLQPSNDVIKPLWHKWMEDGLINEKDLYSSLPISEQEYNESNLDSIYLGYFVPWDSHRNYELAKRWGFKHLEHEYIREGTIEQYNQIDSISYLLNQYLKYPKFGHASATEMASRWIRAGIKTREEMIPYVKKHDKVLDQGIVESFLNFTGMSVREFWGTMDKWYNKDLFWQDTWGIWHEKFDIGVNK